MLETKDQRHMRQMFSVKNVFKQIFQAISKKKGLQNFFSGDLQNFNDLKNSTVLEQMTGQFSRAWGFEAKDLTFEAKNFLEDSTSAVHDS